MTAPVSSPPEIVAVRVVSYPGMRAVSLPGCATTSATRTRSAPLIRYSTGPASSRATSRPNGNARSPGSVEHGAITAGLQLPARALAAGGDAERSSRARRREGRGRRAAGGGQCRAANRRRRQIFSAARIFPTRFSPPCCRTYSITIGPNCLAVSRSMPSSVNDAARPAQRPAPPDRPPNSDPSPPASELSVLCAGAVRSSLSAPGMSATNCSKSGRAHVLLARAQQRDDAAARLVAADAEVLGELADQVVHREARYRGRNAAILRQAGCQTSARSVTSMSDLRGFTATVSIAIAAGSNVGFEAPKLRSRARPPARRTAPATT